MNKLILLFIILLTGCTINVNIIDTQNFDDEKKTVVSNKSKDDTVKKTNSFSMKTDLSAIPKYFNHFFNSDDDVVASINGEEKKKQLKTEI